MASRYPIIQENYLKEYSRFAVPIGAKGGCDAYDLRRESFGHLGDGLKKGRLLRECSRDVHTVIVASRPWMEMLQASTPFDPLLAPI